jgi:hypothetical protein
MGNKNHCLIEVKIPNGSEGWQELVNDKMRQSIEDLKVIVEELGGKVCVRY